MDCTNPAGRREARKADRRREILKVAERSFRAHGFAGTSMSTIAAELGGSKSTLWTYFPSKEALLEAVINSKIEAFHERLYEALDPNGRTATALMRFAKVLLSKILDTRSFRFHRLILSESERFPQIGEAFALRGPGRVRARLSCYLEEEMEAGRLRRGDPLLAARQFLGLCQAGCYLERLWRPTRTSTIDPQADIASAVDTFMRAWGPGELTQPSRSAKPARPILAL